jgi:hypothetical protein
MIGEAFSRCIMMTKRYSRFHLVVIADYNDDATENRCFRSIAVTLYRSSNLKPLRSRGSTFQIILRRSRPSALEWVERGVEAGYQLPVNIIEHWNSSYAPARKTERFKKFVRAAGLVEYWRARLARSLPPRGRRRLRLRLAVPHTPSWVYGYVSSWRDPAPESNLHETLECLG